MDIFRYYMVEKEGAIVWNLFFGIRYDGFG